MKCHYEVLGISADADSDEIKKAYRKLALQWHPDKNPDHVEECTKHFTVIQQAFDVLSDPHERAWYDKHRDAIIKGGLDGNYKDESLNVYQYFNSSCYLGFNDSEKGFYTVYRKVFETITTEDLAFIDKKQNFTDIPEFGVSDSSYEEVVKPFYDHWQTYCTAKSFVWVEKFDIREAPNRKVLRLMEKENKKLRDAAKKERNEEVKELVAFVRKRDKRVQAYRKKLENKAAEIAQQVEIKKEQQRLKSLRLMENYKEAEWSSMSKVEKELKEVEANMDKEFCQENSTEEDDDNENQLYCVACDKVFKSKKALDNHCNSRKHKENADLLTSEMLQEEYIFQNGTSSPKDSSEESESDKDLSMEATRTKLSKKKKKKRRNIKNQNFEDLLQDRIDNDIKEATSCIKEVSIHAKENEVNTYMETESEIVVNSCEADELSKETPKAKKIVQTKTLTKASESRKKLKMTNTTSEEEQETAEKLSCSTCKAIFQSRNKLFEHLKTTNHAAAPTSKKSEMNDQEKKKGKKRR